MDLITEISAKYHKICEIERERLMHITQDTVEPSQYSVNVGLAHREKNRYDDVMPYDQTRVILQNDGNDGYINASHIHLGGESKILKKATYIATQGPTGRTLGDFWQMCDEVCQKHIVIVMLTPLVEQHRRKCSKYWNDGDFNISGKNGSKQFQFKFIDSSYSEKGHFKVSRWEMQNIRKGGPKKLVTHFYYDQWKDFSKPSGIDEILQLRNAVNKVAVDENDPLIVHCSAGVGRTGTFITIHYLLTKCGKHLHLFKDYDPIQKIVLEIREQRMLMVQRVQQYQFVYDTIKKYWLKEKTL